MSKRMFEILDEMNVLDGSNGTSLVQVCGQQNIISVDKKGDYGEVKVGVPASIPLEVMVGKDIRFLLLVIDGKKYDELSK
jgi:hypothetical protein